MDYKFSLNEGEKSEGVAIINKDSANKKLAGKIIYLNKNDDEDEENDKLQLFYEFAKNKQIKQDDYDELKTAVEENEYPDDKKLRKIYDDFKHHIKKSNEIVLKDCNIEVLPLVGSEDRIENESILICGAKGSGKSYWAGNYMKKFNKFFPKSPIYLLSNKKLKDEPAFEGVKNITQLPLNEDILHEIIGKRIEKKGKGKKKVYDEEYDDEDEELMNNNNSAHERFKSKTGQSLVVFDDFEGSELEKLIRLIIDNITSVGRSSRIYSLIISHVLCNGKATKMVLSEADCYVLYPRGISPYHIKYCLKNYTRLNEKQITKIIDSNSRWIFVKRSGQTNYVIEEHRLWMF